MVLRPFHGLNFLSGSMNSASGYLWNNVPTARILSATAVENAVYTTAVGFSNYAVTSSPAEGGLMVHDFDPQGVLRPLITWSFSHSVAGISTGNFLQLRFVSTNADQWYTYNIPVALQSAQVLLGIERNAAEKKWRFFYAAPGLNLGRWTYVQIPFNSFVPWTNTWDVYDNMLPGNMQVNATVGLFGATSGPVSHSQELKAPACLPTHLRYLSHECRHKGTPCLTALPSLGALPSTCSCAISPTGRLLPVTLACVTWSALW